LSGNAGMLIASQTGQKRTYSAAASESSRSEEEWSSSGGESRQGMLPSCVKV